MQSEENNLISFVKSIKKDLREFYDFSKSFNIKLLGSNKIKSKESSVLIPEIFLKGDKKYISLINSDSQSFLIAELYDDLEIGNLSTIHDIDIKKQVFAPFDQDHFLVLDRTEKSLLLKNYSGEIIEEYNLTNWVDCEINLINGSEGLTAYPKSKKVIILYSEKEAPENQFCLTLNLKEKTAIKTPVKKILGSIKYNGQTLVSTWNSKNELFLLSEKGAAKKVQLRFSNFERSYLCNFCTVNDDFILASGKDRNNLYVIKLLDEKLKADFLSLNKLLPQDIKKIEETGDFIKKILWHKDRFYLLSTDKTIFSLQIH